MRGAPPVQMACGRDARAAVAVGLLAAAAAASLAGWLAWHAGAAPGLLRLSIVLAALAGGGAGWWQVARWGERRLAWDGRAWTLDGTPGEVAVLIDVGHWMQLRFRSAAGATWLPLGLRRCGAPVHLARAALLAHAGRAQAGSAAGLDLHG